MTISALYSSSPGSSIGFGPSSIVLLKDRRKGVKGLVMASQRPDVYGIQMDFLLEPVMGKGFSLPRPKRGELVVIVALEGSLAMADHKKCAHSNGSLPKRFALLRRIGEFQPKLDSHFQWVLVV